MAILVCLSSSRALSFFPKARGAGLSWAIPVYCMDRRWWGTGEPGAGVVVTDGLNDTGYDGTEHADDAGCRDGGHPPLD